MFYKIITIKIKTFTIERDIHSYISSYMFNSYILLKLVTKMYEK